MIALLMSVAYGWECQSDFSCPNDCFLYKNQQVFTYKIDTADIPAGWIPSIDAAAVAWGSGPNQLNAGPEWVIQKGANVSSHGESNGKNEIWDDSAGWFIANGMDGATPYALRIKPRFVAIGSCPNDMQEVDIVFNHDLTWSTGLTSDRTDLTRNVVGQAAMRAFASISGLEIADFAGATVWESATNSLPNGNGDASQEWRIGGDDFAGILDLHPCNGVECVDGYNVTVTKFVHDLYANGVNQNLPDGVTEEVWDTTGAEAATEVWSGVQGAVITADLSPHRIVMHLTGTQDNVDVEVRWRLASNANCGGTWAQVASQTHQMDAGDTIEFFTNGFTVPATLPDGSYFLCAIADPLNVLSETDEDDNNIRSERMFTIL